MLESESSITRYIDEREESQDRLFEIIPAIYEVADYLQINSLCLLCVSELKNRSTKRIEEEWRDNPNLNGDYHYFSYGGRSPGFPSCRGSRTTCLR